MEDLLLSHPTVRCSAIKKTCSKLNRMIADGSQNLLVIADFDFTITRSHCSDNSNALCSDGVFDEEINRRDALASQMLKDLCTKYQPLEHDLLLSSEEKAPFMELWWSAVHEVIIKCGFNTKTMMSVVQNAHKLQLREGAVEFFQLADSHSIPVVIYSAGIGDVILSAFEKYLLKMPSNLHVISNWMDINSEGTIIGFKPPLIHCFNKSSKVIPKDAPFLKDIGEKFNVLLLGDNLGDARLDDGLVNDSSNVLKIGFYNRTCEKLLPKFTDIYDIVLVNDQTFDVVNEIIRNVSCSSMN